MDDDNCSLQQWVKLRSFISRRMGFTLMRKIIETDVAIIASTMVGI